MSGEGIEMGIGSWLVMILLALVLVGVFGLFVRYAIRSPRERVFQWIRNAEEKDEQR